MARGTRDTGDSGIRSCNDMTLNFSQGNRIIARAHFTGMEFRDSAWRFVGKQKSRVRLRDMSRAL